MQKYWKISLFYTGKLLKLGGESMLKYSAEDSTCTRDMNQRGEILYSPHNLICWCTINGNAHKQYTN